MLLPSMAEPHECQIELSIIAPAHNEEENVGPLVEEIHAALAGFVELAGRFEAIIVDDGSTDRTLERLTSLMTVRQWLRVVRMMDTPPGRGHGQSAAFHAGLRHARGEIVALLDADLQNDPADLPRILEIMRQTGADLVQGDRSLNRRDTAGRRAASWVGRSFRRLLLADSIRDTGCSLRVMRREVALAIPLEFHGMHRFIPLTARQLGYTVIETPVSHRPRTAGAAKYGVFNRALPGLLDCLAVRWMHRRRRPTRASEVRREDTGA